MAEITIVVTKAQVVYVQPGLWNINMHLSATDETETVIDKDYSVSFRKGDIFSLKSKELIGDMQVDINKYYSERFIYSNKDIDILTITVSEGLDVSEPTELVIVRKKA